LSASDAKEADRLAASRYFYSGTGRLRFVDKNNQNGLAVPYLHALFPDAHFVYVKRSPGDNLNSLIEGWGKSGAFGGWSGQLPHSVSIDKGRYTRWCFFLAKGWEDYRASSIETVCAFQYRSMNEAILAAKLDVPEKQWSEIRYEDILSDPVSVFRQAFAEADLPFDSRLRAHCETVLARPYNAFSEICQDKWRDSPHASRIERVLPDLSDLAERMGY
jgi:hypothetical protein